MQKLKNVLISQPKPEAGKSPYFEIEKKYSLKLDFKKFFEVVGVPAKDFRKDRITITDYSAIILNSRNAIDHLFRICEEMRVKLSQETKFFCSSEAIALYLQKYTQYRKRKVFFSSDNSKSLQDLLLKHKDERYLWPCSDIHQDDLPEFLDKHGFKYDKAVIYRTEPADFSGINIYDYDAILFFSPAGIKSLFANYPNFKQGDIRLGAMGASTAHAIQEAGLRVDLQAPTLESPSMVKALENYLKNPNPAPIEPVAKPLPTAAPAPVAKAKAAPVKTAATPAKTTPAPVEKPAAKAKPATATKPAPAKPIAKATFAKPAAKPEPSKKAAPAKAKVAPAKAAAKAPAKKAAAAAEPVAQKLAAKTSPAKPATKKPVAKTALAIAKTTAKPIAKPQSGKKAPAKPIAKAKVAAKPMAKKTVAPAKPVASKPAVKAAPAKAKTPVKAVAKKAPAKPVAKAKPAAKAPAKKKK